METHRNNIGLLRLLLAGLVIVGHAPEMTDGDRHRDLLTGLLGTVSTGEFAVDGFFLLSGYLIARSMIFSASIPYYLERRIFRIYPGFVVAYLLTVFVLGPIVGAHPWTAMLKTLGRPIFLMDPIQYPGQLAGLPVPALNGSMWTIAYEFRCYLLIAFLWWVGLLEKKRAMLAFAGLGLVASIAVTFDPIRMALDGFAAHYHLLDGIIGVPSDTLRLTSVFLMGAIFYLYRNALLTRLNGRAALVCFLAAAALMFRDPHLAEAALTTLGAISLFWLAFQGRLGPLQHINNEWDISYGVYLYGWPIAILLLWLHPTISPWTLTAIALPLALAWGAASWWGVEKWTKDIRKSRSVAARRTKLPQPVKG